MKKILATLLLLLSIDAYAVNSSTSCTYWYGGTRTYLLNQGTGLVPNAKYRTLMRPVWGEAKWSKNVIIANSSGVVNFRFDSNDTAVANGATRVPRALGGTNVNDANNISFTIYNVNGAYTPITWSYAWCIGR